MKIAEIVILEDVNGTRRTFSKFFTFERAVETLNKIGKQSGFRFVADESLFGGYFVDDKTGHCWSVR